MTNKFKKQMEAVREEMSSMYLIEKCDEIQMYNTPANNKDCIYMKMFGYEFEKSPVSMVLIEYIEQLCTFEKCQDGFYRFIEKEF